MIISNIRIEEKHDKARLIATVQLSEDCLNTWIRQSAKIDKAMFPERYHTTYLDKDYKYDMWYELPIEYKNALCDKRSDAFVVACLYFAIITREDIHTNIPITDKLHYQLQEYQIPAVCDESLGYRKIKIVAPTAPELEERGKSVGTGISCGIDSFTSVVLNTKDDIPSAFKLTHLCIFNTGALNYGGYSPNISLEEWTKTADVEFYERCAHGKEVADQLNLKMLCVNSNIPLLYQGAFSNSNLLRNCSAVLATQNIWQYYYYASAGWGVRCEINLAMDDTFYDTLTLPNLSLSHLHFMAAGAPYYRVEKTMMISSHPIVQKYINVCAKTTNCGKCTKCIRTLTTLDILGVIDKYHESFPDMTYYYKSKDKNMLKVMEASDLFSYDLRQYAKRIGYKFSLKTKLFHLLKPVRVIRIFLLRLLGK